MRTPEGRQARGRFIRGERNRWIIPGGRPAEQEPGRRRETRHATPPDTTITQLAAQGIDLSKLHEDRWNGAKVWVVGAERGDTATSQFWIEQDRLLFVRVIEARNRPQAAPSLLDLVFERYQPLGKGWVAPGVVIKLDGKEVQRDAYRDIRADAPLQADLYDTQTYHKAEWIGGR
jgi:hypothetical protein